jgi:uncharacterized membrane protein
MINRQELKFLARKQLRAIFWAALLICLMAIFLGDNIVGSTNFVSFTLFGFLRRLTDGSALQIVVLLVAFQYFVAGPISAGRARFFLRPAEEADIRDVFFAFRTKHYWRIAFGQFVAIFLIVAAFSLPFLADMFIMRGQGGVARAIIFMLLFIPGIRLSYRFRLLPYVLAENPDLDPGSALNLCSKQALGMRWEIFKLDMSFLGWYILAPLAFGIGIFFVLPYHEATMAQLYHELKKMPGEKPETPENKNIDMYNPEFFELSK